jgi:tetratricopeptide (TPR) repeat protein
MHARISLHPRFARDVARWARGEITWAQVEGFTEEQAREFAQTACQLARKGQLKKAAKIFEGLVALNPLDHASRAALGGVYQRMGRFNDAMGAYDAAIATDGRDVVARANRGELRLLRGDAGGLDDLRTAIEVDQDLVTAAAKRAKAVLMTRAARPARVPRA